MMRYQKVSDTSKKCLTLLQWWFWTVIGLRPIPVASRQKVSDTFLRKGVRHFFALLLVALTVVSVPVSSADPSEEKVELKTVTGKLGMVRPTKISVEDTVNGAYAHEYLLPVAKDVRLQHVREFKQLAQGDTVRVTYQQTYTKNEKGDKVLLKVIATEISLIKPASADKGLVSREQP
jgi:hypothetical protein